MSLNGYVGEVVSFRISSAGSISERPSSSEDGKDGLRLLGVGRR